MCGLGHGPLDQYYNKYVVDYESTMGPKGHHDQVHQCSWSQSATCPLHLEVAWCVSLCTCLHLDGFNGARLWLNQVCSYGTSNSLVLHFGNWHLMLADTSYNSNTIQSKYGIIRQHGTYCCLCRDGSGCLYVRKTALATTPAMLLGQVGRTAFSN